MSPPRAKKGLDTKTDIDMQSNIYMEPIPKIAFFSHKKFINYFVHYDNFPYQKVYTFAALFKRIPC